MGASRLLIYTHDDLFVAELPPADVFERRRVDEVGGRHTLTLTTTRVLEKGQRVLSKDGSGKWREYVVTQPDDRHEVGDRPIGTYLCEWSLQVDLCGVTCDSMPGVNTQGGTTAALALAALLENTSRWGVGTVSVGTSASASFYHMSAWEALGVLCEAWGCEVDAELTMGASGVASRSVALYTRVGSTDAVRRFDWSRDITAIGRKQGAAPVYSRIMPLGRGEEKYDADGNVSGYGRRINITSVNDGKDYLQNDDTLSLTRIPDGSGGWEYPTRIVVNDMCVTPTELLLWAQSVLPDYTEPQVTYYASVVHLAEAGMDTLGVALGDTVVCVDRGFCDEGLRITGRVVKMSVDELDESGGTDLVIGEAEQNVASVFKQLGDRLAQAQSSLQRLMNTSVTTADYMEHVFDQLNAQINATGGSFYILPGRGAVTYDADVTDPYVGSEASKAVEIRGGAIRIANSRTQQGEWDWQTIITSGHIAANLVTAANLVAGFIGSPSGNYWNLDTGELHMAASALTLDGKDVATTDEAVADVSVYYAINNSTSTAPTSGWTKTPSASSTGVWWTKTVTTYQDGSSETVGPVCIQGRDGTDGSDGTSVTILGSYASAAALNAAHPTGSTGDSYIVSGDLYVWDGSAWTNVGTVQGPQGPAGADGQDGASVTITGVVFASGNSGTSYPSSGWQSTVPSVAQGAWLWCRTTYSDGTVTHTCSYMGTDGQDGTSVAILSATKVNGVTTVVIDDGGTQKTLTIADGEDGTNGTNGVNGYVHTAWATSADGSTGFSTSVSAGKTYLGVYTDSTQADSSTPSDYSWSLIKGTDGVDGEDGRGIVSVTPQYYLSTSSSSATGGQWVTTMPQWESGKYIWTRTETVYDDGTTEYTATALATALNKSAQDAAQALSKASEALGDNLIPYAGSASARYGWLVGNGTLNGDSTASISAPSALVFTYYVKPPRVAYALIKGKTCTLSFNASLAVDSSLTEASLLVYAEGYHSDSTTRYGYKTLDTKTLSKTDTRYTITFTATHPWPSSSAAASDRIRFGFYCRTAGAALNISDIKLEYGSEATPYRPSAADMGAEEAITGETQLEVFNKLTNGGSVQGLFIQDGKVYLNGQYLAANTVTADSIDVTDLIVQKLGNGPDNYMKTGTVSRGSSQYLGFFLKSANESAENFGFYGKKVGSYVEVYGNAGEMETNTTSPSKTFLQSTQNGFMVATTPNNLHTGQVTAERRFAKLQGVAHINGVDGYTEDFCGLRFDGALKAVATSMEINSVEPSISFKNGSVTKKLFFPVPITMGGTGASTVAGAASAIDEESLTGTLSGFGYMASAKQIYMYFPVCAWGSTSVACAPSGSTTTVTITLRSHGSLENVTSVPIADLSCALANGGALLRVVYTAAENLSNFVSRDSFYCTLGTAAKFTFS